MLNPNDPDVYYVPVSRQLVEEAGDDWSEPVQFKFLRHPEAETIDIAFRRLLWPTLRSPGGPEAATRETR